MKIIYLTKGKSFTRIQERQIRGVPNALRVVHSKLWVCYNDGVAIHPGGELSMLTEEVFLQLKDGQGEAVGNIHDVTGTFEHECAVAAAKGGFVYSTKGNVYNLHPFYPELHKRVIKLKQDSFRLWKNILSLL